MSNSNKHLEYTGINYQHYIRASLNHWYLFVLSLSITFGISYVVSKLIPRQYEAQCNIVIGDDPALINESNYVLGGYNFNQINPINKEIGIIRSKNLAEQTLEDLNYDISYFLLIKGRWIKRSRYGNVPFRIVADSLFKPSNEEFYFKLISKDSFQLAVDELRREPKTYAFGDYIKHELSYFKIERTYFSSRENYINSEYTFKINKRYQLVNKFVRNLSVEANQTSNNILTLRLRGDNDEQLILYLNTLCRNYIENDIIIRNRMAENTIRYIDGQLSILSEKLRNSENKLIQFRKKENIYDLEIGDQFRDEIKDAQRNLQHNQLTIQNLENLKIMLDSFALGKRNEIIPNLLFIDENSMMLINELNKLIVTRQYLLKNQNENSPEAIKNNQHIEIQLSLLRDALQKRIISYEQQKKVLSNELNTLEGDMVQMTSSERQLAKLQREFDLAENIYNTYQEKRIEAVLAKASTVSNIRLLDSAKLETVSKIRPNKLNVQKVSFAIGFLVPLLFVVLKVTINDTITGIKEIRARTDLPVIGKLFHNRSKTYLVADEHPSSAVTESLRTLLARLDFKNNKDSKKVITFTSGSSGEGKTFSALNVATLIAKSGLRTLLIGLDLRKPQLHRIFNLKNEVGLSTYLAEKCKYNDILVETHINNLTYVPSGPVPPNPVELIQKQLLEDFILKARNEYDHIIIDTPPVGIVADALLINRCVDINLFVIRLNHTRKNIIHYIEELSSSQTLKGLHLVINDIQQPERYGSYSQSKYGGYYRQAEKTSIFSKKK